MAFVLHTSPPHSMVMHLHYAFPHHQIQPTSSDPWTAESRLLPTFLSISPLECSWIVHLCLFWTAEAALLFPSILCRKHIPLYCLYLLARNSSGYWSLSNLSSGCTTLIVMLMGSWVKWLDLCILNVFPVGAGMPQSWHSHLVHIWPFFALFAHLGITRISGLLLLCASGIAVSLDSWVCIEADLYFFPIAVLVLSFVSGASVHS